MGHKQLVIGGHDFTREALFGWHPVHLVGLVLKYQETRRHWAQVDQLLADRIEALESELASALRQNERVRSVVDGLKAEVQYLRRGLRQRVQTRRAA